jgi:hypothetical protein
MKRLVVLLTLLSLLLFPTFAFAQGETTNTAFQVANLNQDEAANITVEFYAQDGTVAHTASDTIPAGSSTTYIQAQMGDDIGETFNGSVVISADQEIAAIVNQNTANEDSTSGYNGSYTGFSAGSSTFNIPIVLSEFYGYYTEISIQNAGEEPVDVTVDYVDTACTDDTETGLAKGAAVRFNNEDSCDGTVNSSATINATGPVVAIVNQISEGDNLEQSYNGFSPANGGNELYAPIALKAFYGFNSSMQIQNLSNDPMDITATYSDGVVETVENVLPGASATFLQANEDHAAGWSGSAKITNDTDGLMVGIVNQQGGTSAASYNMYTGGANSWALPSVLYQYYGFTSSFQIQNVSDGPVDVDVKYDDGQTASVQGLAEGATEAFIQNAEAHPDTNWAGSAIVEATGPIVVVVNQDVLTPGLIDYQYSYNAIPLQ